jgi:thiol-disulfide isomerase/thioredoxin
MKKLAILFIIPLVFNTQAQVVYDFNTAQQVALAQDKLIIADYWATWCGPCRVMDKDLWQSEEFKAIQDRFVFLKVDIDYQGPLVQEHAVNVIPRVMVLTANGDVLFDREGYGGLSGKMNYISNFETMPQNIKSLNNSFKSIIGKESPTAQAYKQVAIAFQDLSFLTSSNTHSNKFLSLSDQYLKEADKTNEDPVLAQEIELQEILNHAFRGRIKKSMKKLGKMDELDESLDDLKQYILAYCYKCEGQDKKMKEAMAQINDPSLVSKLEN